MAQQHIGRTRKDGLVTNNKTPTAQELRYAMGDGLLYYVRDDEGRFIPTFAETIWTRMVRGSTIVSEGD